MARSTTTTTAEVAKYLERNDVRPFLSTLVELWETTGMDTSVLAHHLNMLMEDVAEESDIDLQDLQEKDWESLAERLIDQHRDGHRDGQAA